MKHSQSFLHSKRITLLKLFDVRRHLKNSSQSEDPNLRSLIVSLYHRYIVLSREYSRFLKLIKISDSTLQIQNSHTRCNYIYDRCYCKTSDPIIKTKIFNRSLNEQSYWQILIPEKRDFPILNEPIKHKKRRSIKNLKVHCYVCGRETSYDFFDSDDTPRLCIYCHKKTNKIPINPFSETRDFTPLLDDI